MRKIHVVMGATGEYSDRGEWPVKAFLDLSRAQQLVLDAEGAVREIQTLEREKNPFDPDMKIDYTGTTYFIYDVMLDEGVFMNAARDVAEKTDG